MAPRRQRQPGRAGAIKQVAAADAGHTTTDQRNSGANWRSVAGNADTLGIVVDLHDKDGRRLFDDVVRLTGDEELRNLLVIASTMGMRYVVAAGRFNGKGIFSAMCADESVTILSWGSANERMNEIGSRTTAWMAKPDSLAKLLTAVAQQ